MRDVGGVSSNRMVFDIYNPQSEFRNPHLADSRKIEGRRWIRFLKGKISERIQLGPMDLKEGK